MCISVSQPEAMLVHKGHLAMPGDILVFIVTGALLTRDATKHPTMHSTCFETKNFLEQWKIEKPSFT
jgi:hypothetical protein